MPGAAAAAAEPDAAARCCAPPATAPALGHRREQRLPANLPARHPDRQAGPPRRNPTAAQTQTEALKQVTEVRRISMSFVADVRPSSRTSPRTCWKIKYSSLTDTRGSWPISDDRWSTTQDQLLAPHSVSDPIEIAAEPARTEPDIAPVPTAGRDGLLAALVVCSSGVRSSRGRARQPRWPGVPREIPRSVAIPAQGPVSHPQGLCCCRSPHPSVRKQAPSRASRYPMRY